MIEIYECRDCGKYFTTDQMDEKEICNEEYYGVSGQFAYNTYTNVCCCPYCQSTDFEECNDDEEICTILNA